MVKKGNKTTEEFIVAWQQSATMQEVCDKLDLKYINAYTRARRIVKLGVPLKKLTHRRTFDVAKLKELAAKSLAEFREA